VNKDSVATSRRLTNVIIVDLRHRAAEAGFWYSLPFFTYRPILRLKPSQPQLWQSTKSEMYEDISKYYDLIHQGLRDDIVFVIKLATSVGDPILELGCGTGRLILPLARAGHEITGLDNSAAMLEVARHHIEAERAKVRQRIRLISGDMTSFQLEERYGLIVIGHNTLMHLTRQQVESCLYCARHHLKPTGQLMLDVDNPVMMANPSDDEFLVLERTAVESATGNNIVQMSSSWVDQQAQTRHITWIFDSSPRDGGSIRRTVVNTDFHYLFAHQLEMIFDSCGLVLKDIFGDYDASPYSEDCPRMLMVVGLS
jgi:ubiquinone/menaquinone biosynthesis C-methylase UbiE